MASQFEKEIKDRMSKSVSVYEQNLHTIRAGRANPAVLDNITVDYYGTETPLKQVGNINVPEPRMLTIQPWDAKMVDPIEKAILKSDLGINPSNDGKVIRLAFPILTEERRTELTKTVRKEAENAKVAVRNIRREFIDKVKKLEKDKEINEDDRKSEEDDIQKLTDQFVEEIDAIADKKEAELMEI